MGRVLCILGLYIFFPVLISNMVIHLTHRIKTSLGSLVILKAVKES